MYTYFRVTYQGMLKAEYID